MKKTLLTLTCALVASTALMADDVKTTIVTGTGTVAEYVPGNTFVVKETEGPVTYTYGDSVTYVTKSGKVLTSDDARTRIRVGVPVSVGYTLRGKDRVISRVEVDDD